MTVRSVITSTLHIRRGRADDSAALTALARRSKARWGYPVEWLDAWSEDLTLRPMPGAPDRMLPELRFELTSGD